MKNNPFEELEYFKNYNKEVNHGIRLKGEPRSSIDILFDLYGYGYWMGAARRNGRVNGRESQTRILPYIHTPYTFIEDQLNCIERYAGPLQGDILTFNIDYGYFLVEVSKYSLDDINIHLYTDDREVYRWSQKHPVTVHYDPEPIHDLMRCMYNVERVTFEDGRKNDKFKYIPKMKFDYVIGNPPYQFQVGESKTEPIWPKFVKHSFKICKTKGHVSLVHPSGWRAPRGKFEDIKSSIFSKNVKYISMHDFDEGKEMFGAHTSYDWYVVKNEEKRGSTTIVFQDGIQEDVDLSSVTFLPNGSWHTIKELITDTKDDRLDCIHSWGAYETRSDWINDEKMDEYIHPCVYTITKNKGVNLKYSSRNDKGHFGVPKVIWSNGEGTYPIIDKTGEYGLTQFAYAIADEPEKLKRICDAMDSEEFRSVMDDCRFTNNPYSYKVIELFKKDFWKEFVN